MKQIIERSHLGTLFCAAFFVRAIVMALVIQPHGFYKQADSMDYHNCAVMLATGNGMFRPDIKEPIFWRTPGYPPYLALFYQIFGITHPGFDQNRPAQLAALWLQILLASVIPIILFYLAYLLTSSALIAKIVAWISVIHPGLVLATTYLLSEGLALIFFYLFLIFFFKIVLAEKKNKNIFISAIFAALTLAIYTWMRPMGEFIAIFSTLFIALRKKLKAAALFAALFFVAIAPWYIRNHALTGEWFFCPTIGTYLNCFSVPKILRRTLNRPIEECFKIANYNAAIAVQREKQKCAGTGKHVSNNACKHAAYPVIQAHPGYFIYDWTMEVLKTTFDLYSYQLVSMINDSYWYDPIEEYLPHKIGACLYAQSMPWYARLICWLEFIASIFIWIGFFAGSFVFLLRPLIQRKKDVLTKHHQTVWFFSILIIGLTVGMTGGFGYARLRLPAEPLIIILALSWWLSSFKRVLNKVIR